MMFPVKMIIRHRMAMILIIICLAVLILFERINILTHENLLLKTTIEMLACRGNTGKSDKADNATFDAVNSNKNPREFLPSEVTILLLKRSEQSLVLGTRLEKIKRLFPSSPIKWDDKSNNMATSLNRMIKDIQTEYFMVLEPDVSLSDKETDEGLATLWDALERYPEIDFIGGSYLSGDKLHISCQRFNFCKWTFSETYEYKRSLDLIMICDGTSASFMGRKQSVKKVQNGFDINMTDMLVIKDFFIRAKTANVVVATRPSFMLLADGFKSMYDEWQSHDITKDLVPFAVKHKVFIFKDEEGNLMDLCSPTSPLSGKDLCIEKNAHSLMLNNGHWAHQGLHTYPFILKYLKVSLKELSNFFEEHNISYDFYGGVALGAVKMRSILPWEAGDLDIHVYGMDVPQLLNLLQPWVSKKGYLMREHEESKAVHVFCTPKEIGDVSGGLATIFPSKDPPPEYIRIKTNGVWVRYTRSVFQNNIEYYGMGHLEHKLYETENALACKIKGHNACLPNFTSIFNGKGGTYREYFNFCDS